MTAVHPALVTNGKMRFAGLDGARACPSTLVRRAGRAREIVRGVAKGRTTPAPRSHVVGPRMNIGRHRCSWTIQARVANLLLMNTNRKRLPLALACFLALPIVSGQVAEARCLTPAEAQAVVGKGAVQRLGAIARVVGGEIVDAQLCEGGGSLVYRLAVMREGGRVDNIIVDATSGQQLR